MTTLFQEVNRLTRQSSIKASNKTMYTPTEKSAFTCIHIN